MADDRTPPTPEDEQPPSAEPQADAPQPEQPEQPAGAGPEVEEHDHEQQEGVVEETTPASEAGTPGTPGAPGDVAGDEVTAAEVEVEGTLAADDGSEAEDDEDAPAPREKPAIPGADLEVDIVTDRDRT